MKASSSTVNLNLVVWDSNPETRTCLEIIAKEISRLGADVRPRVVNHHKLGELRLVPQWFAPTLSLALYSVPKRKLLPGRFVSGYFLPKDAECRRLDAAGVPVPPWTVVAPETRLDPAQWGPYVVEKPALGALGANVRIRKTNRVRFHEPSSYPADHYGRQGPMLAQRFVYTGPRPASYRVITLFGEALLCYRQVSERRGPPLAGRWDFGAVGGISIVSNVDDMTVELSDDAQVIALAERAHRQAFPECPTLGCDIIRDFDTGELFVLECHPQGSWLFSDPVGKQMEADNGIDFRGQFDAYAKAARIIAETAPRLAMTATPFASGR